MSDTPVSILPRRRWVRLGSLLLAEYLLVSFLFDVEPLRRASGWHRGLGYLGIAAPLVLAVVTAVALLYGRRLQRALPATEAPRPSGWWLLAHGLAYAVFLATTATTFRGSRIASEPLLLTWLASGVAFPVLLIRAAVPFSLLSKLIRTSAPALLGAALVGLLAWGAGLASARLWDPLGNLTLRAVVAFLGGLVSPVVFDPGDAVVGTADFSVRVAPVCSGYEGIGLMVVFLGAYLWFFRGAVRWPRAWLLLPIAVITVWLANVARIVGLILVGHHLSPEIAYGGFHSKAGWLLFCVVALSFVALARRSRWLSTQADDSFENPVVPFLAPLVVLLATMLVTGLFASGIDLLYPVRVVTAGAAILSFAPHRHLWGSPSVAAVVIGVVVAAIWILTSDADHAFPTELAAMPTAAMMGWLALRLVGTVVVVPIVEELAFRGYLMRRLIARDFDEVAMTRFAWWAVLGSSLAFGFLHQRFLVGTLAGVLFAVAMLHRGRLRDAVLAHAVANGALVAWAVATGQWGLWL